VPIAYRALGAHGGIHAAGRDARAMPEQHRQICAPRTRIAVSCPPAPVRCVCRYMADLPVQEAPPNVLRLYHGEVRHAHESLLRRPNYERFQATLAILRRECVPAYPVIVRTKALPGGIEGLTIRRRKRFVVFLDAGLTDWQAVEVLLHEWSHALSWSHALDRACDEHHAGMLSAEEFHARSHDATFGIALAECYRAVTRPTR